MSRYTFVQADSQPGTGTTQRLDPGAVMTVKDLITMMIIVSDNTATGRSPSVCPRHARWVACSR